MEEREAEAMEWKSREIRGSQVGDGFPRLQLCYPKGICKSVNTIPSVSQNSKYLHSAVSVSPLVPEVGSLKQGQCVPPPLVGDLEQLTLVCAQLSGRQVIPCLTPLEVGAGLQEGEGELAKVKGASQIPEGLKSVPLPQVR